ncbi:unnamed protein product [Rhizoctonia solani]|uniref:Uncharacterized protein n=1 Tax=Rhizoctonia solani TaxID=456999 RepID=A0A8H2WM20_9AGAM|nr:unnamed protein product [Rhizoctonia solani]
MERLENQFQTLQGASSAVPSAPQSGSDSSISFATPTAIHKAWCNNCSVRIRGVRYKCQDCFDFDFCNDCMRVESSLHHSGQHRFFVLRHPAKKYVPGLHNEIYIPDLPGMLTPDRIAGAQSSLPFPAINKSNLDSTERGPPGSTRVELKSDVSGKNRNLSEGAGSSSPQYVASTMYKDLVEHGCVDLMSRMDPLGFSSSAVAEGGFGDVWAGNFHSTGQNLAIKVLRFAPLTGDTAQKELKRITREIYHWSKLDHENIHKLMGVTLFRERLGMVSEWMEHGNLRQYLSRNSDVDRLKLCVQIARGVSYPHSINMVHGDLKACNILVSSTGILKITDFDYSIFPECSLMFSATTRMGGGTLRWMAPELLLDEACPQRNIKTDIYALGMTFLETMTNAHPYTECWHNHQILNKLLRRQHPKRSAEYFPDAQQGAQMWSLLLQCWDFTPTSRPIAKDVLGSLLTFKNQPL